MIAAVHHGAPFADRAARQRIEELKNYFGIQHHALDSLLAKTGNTSHPPA